MQHRKGRKVSPCRRCGVVGKLVAGWRPARLGESDGSDGSDVAGGRGGRARRASRLGGGVARFQGRSWREWRFRSQCLVPRAVPDRLFHSLDIAGEIRPRDAVPLR